MHYPGEDIVQTLNYCIMPEVSLVKLIIDCLSTTTVKMEVQDVM